MKMTHGKESKFTRIALSYYKFKPMRVFVYFLTFICQVALLIYLMVLPIQLAYHSMLSSAQNKHIQDNVDFYVCGFFTIHLLLYFDNSMQKIVKSPNALPKYTIGDGNKWSRLITFELGYDLLCWGISVFMASPEQNSFEERILELIFFFKIYKIYKFHKRVIYSIIGTVTYPVYRIFFTIMVTFTVISYLSSIFYAIDYSIYINGGPLDNFIFLINMGSEPKLIEKPFWVQLLIINYWAMGTSSTAAYGDICGTAPQQVIFNIFILYFANFLYGYYLNNIQIIPKEIKKRERRILQQFNHFQKYNQLGFSNKKKQYREGKLIDDQLYLKILCSIQYNQTEKSIRKIVNESIPEKYIQQIKVEIYSEFFTSEQLKLYRSKGFFNRSETLLKVSKAINESVFQKQEDIYEYDHINETDLFYIHEGSIELKLPGELSGIISVKKNTGDMFGEYCFITNQRRKIQAIASEYVSAYIIKREDYKKCLSLEEFLHYDSMFGRCLELTEEEIQNEVYKRFNDILEERGSAFNINTPGARFKILSRVLKERKTYRKGFDRQKLQTKKIYIHSKNNTKKTIATQTQNPQPQWPPQFQNVVKF